MTRILFVDDDREYIDSLKSLFQQEENDQQEKYNIVAASTANEARTLLSSESEFDLAIVDVRLVSRQGVPEDQQDESGLYLARDIAEQGTPILILTGYPNYEYVRRVQTWFPDGTPAHINFVGKREESGAIIEVVKNSLRGRNVFIVHGHNRLARLEVTEFIRDCGLVPIVLQEKAHEGRTIFQQFEYYSSVAYVLVLLTPDDECHGSDGKDEKRARQNVIFELGYFIAKYGPRRVKALVYENVVLPSDLDGMLYIRVKDNDDWKWQLTQELRTIGLRVKKP